MLAMAEAGATYKAIVKATGRSLNTVFRHCKDAKKRALLERLKTAVQRTGPVMAIPAAEPKSEETKSAEGESDGHTV